MAAKKKTSKTDFVRKFPDLPAADVVKKGAEAGLKFSDKYVYKVRAVDRSKSKKGGAPAKAPAAAKANGAPKAAKAAAPAAAKASGKMTTTDFVKSLPPKMSFKEAAEKASKLGIKLSKGYFYVLKSGAKKAPGAAKAAPVAAAPKGKPGRKPKAASISVSGKGLRITSDDPNEQALINAVRAIGAGRSRGLIDSIEKFERG